MSKTQQHWFKYHSSQNSGIKLASCFYHLFEHCLCLYCCYRSQCLHLHLRVIGLWSWFAHLLWLLSNILWHIHQDIRQLYMSYTHHHKRSGKAGSHSLYLVSLCRHCLPDEGTPWNLTRLFKIKLVHRIYQAFFIICSLARKN